MRRQVWGAESEEGSQGVQRKTRRGFPEGEGSWPSPAVREMG